MSTLVDPEEAEALADAMRTGADDAPARVAVVTPRDFTEPRTLSADRVARIRKSLSARLQAIANALAGPLRGHPVLSLGEVSEVNAAGLFDGFVRPFLVHGFLSAGQQGWVIWEAPAARAACDTILSGPPAPPTTESSGDEDDEDGESAAAPETPETPEEEPSLVLSRTERRVVASLMDIVAGRLGAELGIEVDSGIVWQEPEDLTTLEDLGPDADSRRLFVHLTFADATGTTSDLRVYLPGLVTPDDQDAGDGPADAPSHLTQVDMGMSVHLGSCDVPLSELMDIEIGDVIPLEARVGDLVEVEIEETTCARGRFGAHDGRLAVLLTEVGVLPPAAEPT